MRDVTGDRREYCTAFSLQVSAFRFQFSGLKSPPSSFKFQPSDLLRQVFPTLPPVVGFPDGQTTVAMEG